MPKQRKNINLEWYVLNGTYSRAFEKEEFGHYPYNFRNSEVKPFNVFNNYGFENKAIELAKAYYNRKEIKDWGICDNFPKNGTDYEKFKFALLRELQYYEHGRCEYECMVCDWGPQYVDKNGEKVNTYNEDHAPIEDVKADKIDCFIQTLMNKDIFCNYVLMEVNGTLEQKPKKAVEKK